MKTWHHWIVALLLGYIAGYYFRNIGNMTIGRIAPSGG